MCAPHNAMIASPMNLSCVTTCSNTSSTISVFFFQAEDGIRARNVTGVQTCALPIFGEHRRDQQGLQRADLRVLGPRRDRRPEQNPAQAHRSGEGEEGQLAMFSANGAVAPAAYPPPVDPQKEFIKRGLDPEEELIEVGVAIVGGGTAGLACANRLLQLLGEDPETMERLGEVPVAVIEKAKTCGGHNLSGAVMRPGPLQELFPDMTREQWREEGFAFGEVRKEAIYVLPSARTKVRIPPPPPQRNHGNEIVSVAALARFQQRQAEEGGAYILTETAATQLIVQDGRVVGVRSGDKGRGKDGEPLSNFEPGTDIQAQVTVLGEGSWGHLTGAAIKEFDLAEGREPQVWELGVKEVWKVPEAPERGVHTVGGWPLKISARYHQIGGSWIYPMKDSKSGEDLVSIGFVIDLDYADATTSAHDLLQQFKTHSLVRKILAGGERVAWGAKAIPAGGYWAMPKLSMPGAVIVGDA